VGQRAYLQEADVCIGGAFGCHLDGNESIVRGHGRTRKVHSTNGMRTGITNHL
jgi:hypothetical protein